MIGRAGLVRCGVRRAGLLAMLGMLLVSAPPASGQKSLTGPGPVQIKVLAKPLPGFDLRDPAMRRFGALEFRGGLELTSDFADFGGISSIRVERDGERFLAVTDKGRWLRGRIR